MIIPAGRQVWVDKCHVCYCPSENTTTYNNANAINNSKLNAVNNHHKVDMSLDDALAKQSQGIIPGLSTMVDTQHAVCVYEKSYACDEEV